MMTPRVVLGLWPIAGITTIGVSETDARATIDAAIEHGITSFDTAYNYGYDGRSDRILGHCIASARDQFTVIGKVGQRWNDSRQRVIDGTPATLFADAEESLERSGLQYFDTLMLHAPDPNVPLEQSASAIAELRRRGKCRSIGVCNVDVVQYRKFREAVGCDAMQCPLNLMQRNSLSELIPECQLNQCDVYVFWVMMKGLLGGRIQRDHRFAVGDPRPGYEVFQGSMRAATHHVVDALQQIAVEAGMSIPQLTIGWALSQQGVSAALVGAHRPDQVPDLASARPLPADMVEAIEAAASSALKPR